MSRNSDYNASSGYHTGVGIKNYMTSSPLTQLVHRPLMFTQKMRTGSPLKDSYDSSRNLKSLAAKAESV